jgi:type IV pilus assembly protein PilB
MLDPESETLKGMLIDENLCTEDQLIEIEEEHERTGKVFQDLLVDYEIISKDELLGLIARNLGTDVVDLAGIEVDKSVVDMIDAPTVRMYGVMPLKYEDETLTVASANPLNYQIAEELNFILGKNIFIVIAPEDQIDTAIEKYYPIESESMHEMLESMDIEIDDGLDNFEGDNVADLADMAEATPIVRFVDVILYQAIKAESSDIHFEPFEHEFKIRYRVDGALYEMSPPPQNLAIPVISRLKIMSGLNIAERRLPQDGRIQLRIAGRPVDLRVSTLPTAHGESVVLRVLDRSVINLDLDVLGIDPVVLGQIRDIIHLPNGIFVVTGPTGSGKTTTLYSALKEINTIEDKLLTAEDPIEYDIEGIIQLPINDSIGMTFARALKAFLRQDPDRIMLGEIRDLETAQMAIQASLTGHFVFSTLHTNDAAGTVTRLIDIGVEPFLITSSLEGVLGQRLIRKICSDCKASFTPTDEDLELLGLDREEIGDRQFCYGKGCSMCNQTGYKGRKALSELLVASKEIKELIIEKAPTIVIREKARELGMKTLREDGIRSILDGDTTIEEVLKYT